jgi:hypothetical protein
MYPIYGVRIISFPLPPFPAPWPSDTEGGVSRSGKSRNEANKGRFRMLYTKLLEQHKIKSCKYPGNNKNL